MRVPVPYFVLAACAGVRGMCMHMCRRYGRTRGVSARRSMGYYLFWVRGNAMYKFNKLKYMRVETLESRLSRRKNVDPATVTARPRPATPARDMERETRERDADGRGAVRGETCGLLNTV